MNTKERNGFVDYKVRDDIKLDAGLKMASHCHATDEAVAEVARLRHACHAGEARLADLLADHRDFCAREESSKEQTRL